jgi:hypothetical protein
MVIVTSVMTTGTNISTQSLYREKAKVQDENVALTEQIEKESSLKGVTSKITNIGYVGAKLVQVRGGSGDSLSMATK